MHKASTLVDYALLSLAAAFAAFQLLQSAVSCSFSVVLRQVVFVLPLALVSSAGYTSPWHSALCTEAYLSQSSFSKTTATEGSFVSLQ